MGINITTGAVTINGKAIDREKLLEHTEREVAKSTEWLPHAKARIREATIIRLRTETALSWKAIGKHPDVRLTPAGVIAAYYRTINRWLEPDEVKEHISKSLRTIDMVNDLAFGLYDKAKPTSSTLALNVVVKNEERKAKLLGLDKPKEIELTDGRSILDVLAGVESVSDAEIAQAQANDPYIRPEGAVQRRDNIVPQFDAGEQEQTVLDAAKADRNAYVPLNEKSEDEIAALDDAAKAFLAKFERANKKHQGDEIAPQDKKIRFEAVR